MSHGDEKLSDVEEGSDSLNGYAIESVVRKKRKRSSSLSSDEKLNMPKAKRPKLEMQSSSGEESGDDNEVSKNDEAEEDSKEIEVGKVSKSEEGGEENKFEEDGEAKSEVKPDPISYFSAHLNLKKIGAEERIDACLAEVELELNKPGSWEDGADFPVVRGNLRKIQDSPKKASLLQKLKAFYLDLRYADEIEKYFLARNVKEKLSGILDEYFKEHEKFATDDLFFDLGLTVDSDLERYAILCIIEAFRLDFITNPSRMSSKQSLRDNANFILASSSENYYKGLACYALAYANTKRGEEKFTQYLRSAYEAGVRLEVPINLCYELALQAYKKKNFTEAKRYLRDSKTVNLPEDDQFKLGKMYFYLKDYEKAVRALEPFESAKARDYYGRSLVRLNDKKNPKNSDIESALKLGASCSNSALYFLAKSHANKLLPHSSRAKAVSYYLAYLNRSHVLSRAYVELSFLELAGLYLQDPQGLKKSLCAILFYLTKWMQSEKISSSSSLDEKKEKSLRANNLYELYKIFIAFARLEKNIKTHFIQAFVAVHLYETDQNEKLEKIQSLLKSNPCPSAQFIYAHGLEKKNKESKEAIRVYKKVAEGASNVAIDTVLKKWRNNPNESYYAALAIQRYCKSKYKEERLSGVKRVRYLKRARDLLEFSVERGNFLAFDRLVDFYKNKVSDAEEKIMTKLLYRSYRHDWYSARCQVLYALLRKLGVPREKFSSQEVLRETVEAFEKKRHDYFGEELSSDSDEDKKECFKKMSDVYREDQESTAHRRAVEVSVEKAENLLGKILDEKFSGSSADKSSRVFEKKDVKPKLPQEFYEHTEDEKRNLKTLDFALHNHGAVLTKKQLKEMGTNFRILGFRGVTYPIDAWNQKNRRSHRERKEDGAPVFSASVYKKVGFTFGRQLSENDIKEMNEEAGKVRTALSALREKPLTEEDEQYLIDRKKTKKNFNSRGDYFQQIFTSSYIGFKEFLKNHYKSFGLPNSEVPNVATGGSPGHAGLYSLGVKPYKGQKKQRLRPRWNKNFRAERPKSGRMTLFFFHPRDFCGLGKANHVLSMHTKKDIEIKYNILPEDEITFLGYIPRGRAVYSHVTKYPSFKGEYSPFFLVEYGITKKFYRTFKAILKKYPPHSKGRQDAKKVLGEYLAAYNNMRLLNIALRHAALRNVKLVFFDEYGHLSFLPAETYNVSRRYTDFFNSVFSKDAKPSEDPSSDSESDFPRRSQSTM